MKIIAQHHLYINDITMTFSYLVYIKQTTQALV